MLPGSDGWARRFLHHPLTRDRILDRAIWITFIWGCQSMSALADILGPPPQITATVRAARARIKHKALAWVASETRGRRTQRGRIGKPLETALVSSSMLGAPSDPRLRQPEIFERPAPVALSRVRSFFEDLPKASSLQFAIAGGGPETVVVDPNYGRIFGILGCKAAIIALIWGISGRFCVTLTCHSTTRHVDSAIKHRRLTHIFSPHGRRCAHPACAKFPFPSQKHLAELRGRQPDDLGPSAGQGKRRVP